MFQSSPECRAAIEDAIEDAVSKSASLETCLAVMWENDHSISAYKTISDKPVMTIKPPAGHEDDELDLAACCSKDHYIFVSGLGPKRNQVYRYDVIKAVWTLLCELNHGRKYHCMLEVKGSLFIFEGYDPESELLVGEVEVVKTESGEREAAGHIEGDRSVNTCCCLIDHNDILVTGPRDDSEQLLLQVYSSVHRKVTHVMQVPRESYDARGVITAAGSVIYADEYNVYTCTVNDLYQQHNNVRRLHHYSLPDDCCTMTLSCDKQKVLLLGGEAEYSVYEADVNDLLTDTDRGWLPVSVQWGRQDYTYPGAVCLAGIAE